MYAHSSISDLSTEVWAHLVSYLPGEYVGRLKSTGAKYLWGRLCHTIVFKTVKLGTDIHLFRSWPVLLSEFSTLQELSIHCRCEQWWSDLDLRLNLIPPTVRKLKLDFGGFAFPLPNFFVSKNGGKLYFERQLPNLESLDLRCVKFEDYSWVVRTSPNLTTLRINKWIGQELPSSLTSLKVVVVNLSGFVSPAPKLPSGLLSMVSFSSENPELLVPLLPPTCQRLSVGLVDGMSQRTVDLLWRSRGRQHFFSENTLSSPDFPCDMVSCLPPTLTMLECGSCDLSLTAWSDLPPTLMTFICSFERSDTHSIHQNPQPTLEHSVQRNIPFEKLPKSLTYLRCIVEKPLFCVPPSSKYSDSTYFPPHLTYLSISNIQLSPEAACCLPSSLTHLDVRNLCEQVCSYLPGGLTTLYARKTVMTSNLVKLFPSSLTNLDFDQKSSDTIVGLPNIGKLCEASHRTNRIEKFDWTNCPYLPRRLTRLKLENCPNISDSFLINQNFTRLVSLDIPSAKYFTDLVIPLLNPHMTSLNLSSSLKVSGDCFPFLPKGLTLLNLNSSIEILDSDIEHLPRSLISISLISAIMLTELCVPYLPSQVETLNLEKNHNITRSCFPKFPYRLRSPQLRGRIRLATWGSDCGQVYGQGAWTVKEKSRRRSFANPECIHACANHDQAV